MKAHQTQLHFRGLKLIAICLSIFLVVCYEYLPKKRLDLDINDPSKLYVVTDAREGGDTSFEWIDKSKTHWKCEVTGGVLYPFCSVSILFSPKNALEKVDLSGFSHLEVDLTYSGEAKYLRFFVRNHFALTNTVLPRKQTNDANQQSSFFDNIPDIEQAKFNAIHVNTETFNSSTSIPLHELSVADWWVEQFKVPPSMRKPDISEALALGIDVPFPFVKGEHYFKVSKIEFVGNYLSKETLYLIIIVIMGIALISEMIFHYIKLKKSANKTTVQLSKLSSENKLFKEKALKDNLSGAYNREGFEDVLVKLNNSNKLDGYAIVIVDIDDFKLINDTHGHVQGDNVISNTSYILNSIIRSDDAVVRWGGEEFLVLFRCDSKANMQSFAEKLRTEIFDSQLSDISSVRVTVSGGATLLSQHATFEGAFEYADKLLYKAKNNGKNAIICD